MRKIILAFTFFVFSAPAFAGSCPLKLNKIDQALAVGNVKNASQVKALRDQGERLHKLGKHGKSVQILIKAMKLAGIK
tara:strand:+ start:3918 stop:4151 length:234 start_codon:yes stop_codon:yes gene_type:complete